MCRARLPVQPREYHPVTERNGKGTATAHGAQNPTRASSEATGHSGGLANDRNPATFWQAASAMQNAWWQLDLERIIVIEKFALTFPEEGLGAIASKFPTTPPTGNSPSIRRNPPPPRNRASTPPSRHDRAFRARDLHRHAARKTRSPFRIYRFWTPLTMNIVSSSLKPFAPLGRAPVLIATLLGASAAFAETVQLDSPDGRLKLIFEVAADGGVTHALTVDRKPVVLPSPVGFAGGHFEGVERREENSVWKPLWGKRSEVSDRYNEATLDFGSYRIQARAYDEGVAFRYLFSGSKPIGAEATAFEFAGDYTAWYYNGEKPNIGPEKLSLANGQRLPVATIRTDIGAYLALHEADLVDGEPLILEGMPGKTSLRVASKPSGAWRVVMSAAVPEHWWTLTSSNFESAAACGDGFFLGETRVGSLGLAHQWGEGRWLQIRNVPAVVETNDRFRG